MENKPLKILEAELNNFNELENSIKNLPKILRLNQQKIKVIREAFESLNECDRDLIQKICIEGKKPIQLENYFNLCERRIYYKKDESLKKLYLALYGVNLFEEGEKENEN
jgi:hypothetical protein